MIFVFEVLLDGVSAEEYAQRWIEASRIIQRSPGAQGTRLHRDLNDPNRLLAIARWRGAEERRSREPYHVEVVKRTLGALAPRCRIRIVGEFSDPEWEVLPEGAGLN